VTGRFTVPMQWALAVFLSVMLWVVSIEERTFEVVQELPVTRPSVPPDFMVLGGIDGDSVRVTFNGSGVEVLLDQVLRRPRAVSPDLSLDDQSGDYPLSVFRELEGSDIVFSGQPYSSLNSSSFTPGRISYIIDRTVSRDLPVAVRSSSQLPGRYYWEVTSHRTVEVSGAESVVGRLDSLYTVPLEPDSGMVEATIVKPEGVIYISPSSILAELVSPVQVISQLQ